MLQSLGIIRKLPVRYRTIATSSLLQVEKSVEEAIAKGKPVVALESTIVAHGMPYPENLELAQEVEAILRSKGVVPATIAVKDGICRVGLSQEELKDLAKAGEEGRAKKCSTRDLPLIASMKPRNTSNVHQWGATTVASTMKLAHLAGISVFVTGGIGGVHRNGHISMDVSADLTELSRTPVVVVSAGIKSILDIDRTLEVLETYSVPTVGWQTDEFPAFFSPESGVACPARADSVEDIASAYWASRTLDLPQGMLVAVPNHDAAGATVEKAIQSALKEAEERGISGQAVTPFILKTVAEKTQGDSLRSNMALVRQNTEIGASIAIAIASANKTKPTAYGSARVQSYFNPGQAAPKGRLNLGIMRRSDDDLRMSPMSPDQPVCEEILNYANIVVIDGGTEASKRRDTAEKAFKAGVEVVFVPSGEGCAIATIQDPTFLPCIKYAVLDLEELLAMSDGWTDSSEDIYFALYEEDLTTIKAAAAQTLKKMNETEAHLLITLGTKGLLLASQKGRAEGNVAFNDFPNTPGVEIHKGTAASDCLCGAFLHQLLEGRGVLAAATEGYSAVENLLLNGQLFYPLLSQFEGRG